MTTTQGLTDLVVIALLQRLRIEILIAFRDYGFVDHVEMIPRQVAQLLRVPFHPPSRSVLVDTTSGASFSSYSRVGFYHCRIATTRSTFLLQHHLRLLHSFNH